MKQVSSKKKRKRKEKVENRRTEIRFMNTFPSD